MTSKKNRIKSAKLGRNNIFKGGKTYSPSGVNSRQSVKNMSNNQFREGKETSSAVNGREVIIFTNNKGDEIKSQENIHITLSPSNFSIPAAKSTKSRGRSGNHTFNVISPGNNAVNSVPQFMEASFGRYGTMSTTTPKNISS